MIRWHRRYTLPGLSLNLYVNANDWGLGLWVSRYFICTLVSLQLGPFEATISTTSHSHR